MRVAALYDIHGNLPALEAVFHEIHQAQVDRIVIGGDVIAGPMPLETLKYLLETDIPTDFIMGNGDEEVLNHMHGIVSNKVPDHVQEIIRWVAQQLPPEYEQVIASWSNTATIPMPELGDVLFCHATPRNNTEIFTRLTPEDHLLPVFAGVTASVVVCGHTHMPFDRTINNIRVVNAGSVGMPYGKSGAHWLLLDSNIHFQHTDYNLTDAVNIIRKTNYPQAQNFADSNILNPPTEEQALEVFTKWELK